MKKFMNEQYGTEVTAKAYKKAPSIYRDMLAKVDDIGADNPMAGNIYMAFIFMAIWKASDGAIDIDSYRTVVRNTATKSFLRKFIGKSDLNSPEGIKNGNEKMHRMKEWADSHPQYQGRHGTSILMSHYIVTDFFTISRNVLSIHLQGSTDILRFCLSAVNWIIY